MLGPAIVIVAGFVTLFLAIESNDGLVADDYYKQGLAINRTMQRDDRARAMNYRAELTLSRESRSLRVMLAGAGARNRAWQEETCKEQCGFYGRRSW